MALTPWFSGMKFEPLTERGHRSYEACKASRTAIDWLTSRGIGYEAAHEAISPMSREIVEQGWRPPVTAPIDGREFVYWTGGQARIGSLGGEIRRDPAMLGWVPLPA